MDVLGAGTRVLGSPWTIAKEDNNSTGRRPMLATEYGDAWEEKTRREEKEEV
jgi:hypothetical protein